MSLCGLRGFRRIICHKFSHLCLGAWQALTATLEAINKFSITHSVRAKGAKAHLPLGAVPFDVSDEVFHDVG